MEDIVNRMRVLLSSDNVAEKERAIDFFTKSELSNKRFVCQFFSPYQEPWSNKKYWDGYAHILCRRGLPAIDDVKIDLLSWWKDANFPGFEVIREFVISNKQFFWVETKEVLFSAYNKKDIGWFKWLLVLVLDIAPNLTSSKQEKIEEIIEYLDDDEWRDFAEKYYDDFIKILK